MIVRTLSAVAALVVAGAAVGQPPATPKKPVEIFRDVRDLIETGRFELAAESLKDFAAIPPTEQDYLDVQEKFGATAFPRLRNISRWYDDPKKDADFKKTTVEAVIQGATAATAKLVNDPKRITRFVGNLAGVREEQLFAIEELRRSGDAAVPVMIDVLRRDQSSEQRTGIFTAVTALDAATVPAFLAAAEGVGDDLKVPLIRAIVRRPDALALATKADTNFVPLLWYWSGINPGSPSIVRDTANELLDGLTGGRTERRRPEAELVRAAEPLAARKGAFQAFDPNTKKVRAWAWDATAQAVRPAELTVSQAEERFGLKYLKWAVERQPGYEPAQTLFLALAAERAVDRTAFGDLARAEPGAYQLLVAAPAGQLVDLLESALAGKQTALAYGLVQVLGDRGETLAATARTRAAGAGTAQRPPVLVQALAYPDPRVQLAAAVALLRMPGPPAHGANARVVEVLARAAAGDPAPAGAKGKALIADPYAVRGDEVAGLLRGLGYATERVGTGRALFRRVDAASDIDLIVVDRHIIDPTLGDVLARLKADADTAGRPVLVVASGDARKQLGLETLLLRLAVLIAVTETNDYALPAPPAIDRRKSDAETENERRLNVEAREKVLAQVFEVRLARLQRIARSADLYATPDLRSRLDLRLPQLTYAAIVAEFDPTPATSPTFFRDFNQTTGLARGLPPMQYPPATDALVRLVFQLETALTPELRTKFNTLRGRIDPTALAIPREPGSDPAVEAGVARAVRPFAGVSVIPEPFGMRDPDPARRGEWLPSEALRMDVSAAMRDPAQQPRDPAEKKAAAKTAVEWLRRIAVGETPGYDLRPAEAALRAAVASDDLADAAIDALAHVPTADAQRDLVRVATAPGRPLPIRVKAAAGAARHVRAYGRLAADQVPANEADPELRAKFIILRGLLSPAPSEIGDRIRGYSPQTAPPAPPPAMKKPDDPKPDDKK